MRLSPLGAALAGAWLTLACDQGAPALDEAAGPPLHAVATFPTVGAGTDCTSAPSCSGVPLNSDIEIRFDRYLDPSTAIRQSVLLYTGTRDAALFLEPEYDVLERVVRYRLVDTQLKPSTLYTFEFNIPTEDNPNGFRAFDGAGLEAGSIPLRFNFFTGETTKDRPEPPATADCQQILDLFRARCGSCHQSAPSGAGGCPPGRARDPSSQDCVGVPRQGLDLSSLSGVERTALGHVAHQTEIGPRGGSPLENPQRVGVQMPIIDASRPENSYLMYKLLRNERNFVVLDSMGRPLLGETRHQVALPSGQLVASEAERARLREWFVRLDPMPAQDDFIELSELRAIQEWIRTGANLSACK